MKTGGKRIRPNPEPVDISGVSRFVLIISYGHTFAVICLENGVDMKTIQEMLGHYSESFTADVYAHVTEKMKKKGADLLENAYQSLNGAEIP